jgi:hypothetical protein
MRDWGVSLHSHAPRDLAGSEQPNAHRMKQTAFIPLVIIAVQLAGCRPAEQKSDATLTSAQAQPQKAPSPDQASLAETKPKPEEYHLLDPQVTGFKLVLNLRSLRNNSDQVVTDADLASAFIDDQGSPFAKGQQFPLELVSNKITNSILNTTKFGNIMIKSDGSSLQVLMMDSQVTMIKKFIGR